MDFTNWLASKFIKSMPQQVTWGTLSGLGQPFSTLYSPHPIWTIFHEVRVPRAHNHDNLSPLNHSNPSHFTWQNSVILFSNLQHHPVHPNPIPPCSLLARHTNVTRVWSSVMHGPRAAVWLVEGKAQPKRVSECRSASQGMAECRSWVVVVWPAKGKAQGVMRHGFSGNEVDPAWWAPDLFLPLPPVSNLSPLSVLSQTWWRWDTKWSTKNDDGLS